MSVTKYQPLYLKYRPQTLKELVGQDSVVKTLSNALENAKITHAYLFTGPRGTGKTSSARILAKSLNCDKGPTIDPCLVCPSCVEIASSSSPSVFEIDAASNNSVDDARSLIERAPLAAQGGKYKIYIVDECHMLTKEAFNALLKTIEEPPPQVVFILATTEEYKVPPTILSRCQRLMFRLVNQEDLEKHLKKVAQSENIVMADDALQLVCRRSGGGLRDALGLFDQASLLAQEGKTITSKDLLVLLGALQEDLLIAIGQGILNGDGYAVTNSVNELLGQGREPSLIALELAKHFLNLVKASYLKSKDSSQIGQFVNGSPSYLEGILNQTKEGAQSPELVQIVEQLERLEQSIKRSSLPVMTLEIGLLSICHRHDINDVNELALKLESLEQRLQNPDMAFAPTPQTVAPRPKPQPVYSPPQVQTTQSTPAAPVLPVPEPVSAEPVFQKAEVEFVAETTAANTTTATMTLEKEPVAENEISITMAEKIEEPESDVEIQSQPTSTPESQDLDILWDKVLDALQKRNIPAYSVVNMHAFPVAQENDVLTLGVKAMFQKTIESKSHHLSQAFKDITGNTITIRVKVMEDGQKPAPRKDPPQSPAQNTASAPAPITEHRPQQEQTQTSVSVREEDSGHEEEDEHPTNNSSSLESDEGEASGSQSAKEAYKLFEGPGSRFIS